MKPILEVRLASDFDSMEHVDQIVDELTQTQGLNEESSGALLLSLSEAVTNAIMHGNKQDPSKWVHVRAVRVGDELEVTVEDEGDGFNPEMIPSPVESENLLRQGGRGVYLMKMYCKDVRFSNGGRALTLVLDVA
jgi:serine/threonine-protein kinase RsbW